MTRRMLGRWGRVVFAVSAVASTAVAEPVARWELCEGDRVVLLGDTFIEREQQSGWIETMLTARFADRTVTFRNLGWSADTPAGDSRFGLSLLQAGHEPAGEAWEQLQKQVAEARPTAVVIGYARASSFAGKAGLGQFPADYQRLLERIAQANMACIFGFRKREQGRNAAEVLRFDALIAQEEARIAKLRTLRETVPAPPVSSSRAEEVAPQPRPQFVVADGLEATLWAENPLLHKPVQMNFDARGRLWVGSSQFKRRTKKSRRRPMRLSNEPSSMCLESC